MNKLKQIIKQITDNDLNTTPGLTTINYLFELIGLKDKVDLRKFSRNFIKIDELIKNTNNEKEDKIIKNDAFNKNFGTNKGEILEGHRMAQILGVEDFGGDVQISGVKKVGYSYWCTANKEMYKCKVENSLNYIDDTYFDAFSNAALLGKLQNLSATKSITNTFNQTVAGVLAAEFVITAVKVGNVVTLNLYMTPLGTGGDSSQTVNLNFILPTEFKPKQRVWGTIRSDNPTVPIRPFGVVESGIITFGFYGIGLVTGSGLGGSITYVV